ncbi:MAG: hypothetical protein Q7V63_01675 [Gammaproteobacteria bacterium]|nr:hypothetical protein [Gammaproteobacteria bacterium]
MTCETVFTSDNVHNLIATLAARKDRIPKSLHHYIDHFIQDLQFLAYKFNSISMSKSLLEGWASVIYGRFNFFFTSLPINEAEVMYSVYESAQDDALKFLSSHLSKGFVNIYYSQKKCTATFAESQSVDKTDFPFMGKSLIEVATDLNANPWMIDLIVVRVAYVHFTNQSLWVALNNRGLAMINLAGMHPLRLRPDVPTVDEFNRLKEVLEPLNLASGDAIEADTFSHFNEINQYNLQAPFMAITGLYCGASMFTVLHYTRERGSYLKENNLSANSILHISDPSLPPTDRVDIIDGNIITPVAGVPDPSFNSTQDFGRHLEKAMQNNQVMPALSRD